MPRPRGSGCITCRIRRVKCDEEKPQCRRCLTTGRKCDGYMPAQSKLSRRDLAALSRKMTVADWILPQRLSQAPSALSPPADDAGHGHNSALQSREYQLFDIFRSTTAPSTASFMPSQFWTREILQLAHSEPAVWHATIALAALHCRWHAETVASTPSNAASPDEADVHYHQAISLARNIHHPTKALALSLALGAAANMMGRLRESHLHVMAGRDMLSESGRTDETAHATEMMARLDLEAMTIGDVRAPYEPRDVDVLRWAQPDFEEISNYEQAAGGLFSMMRLVMLADELPDEVPGESRREDTGRKFMEGMGTWQVSMAKFEKRRGTKINLANVDDVVPALSLRLYHVLLWLFALLSSPGLEMRFDEHLDLFVRMLVLAEGLARRLEDTTRTVTMEPGLVMALFALGSRCRHPKVRRRSLRLLSKLKRQEGIWRSDAAALILKRVIEIEEQKARLHAGLPVSPAQSPSSSTSRSEPGTEGESMNSPDGTRSVGEEMLEEDRLRQALDLPWESWAEPKVKLPSWETWEGVSIIPETCRVKTYQIALSIEERCVGVSFFISSGEEDPPFRAVKEEQIFF